jgi:hypothetical protein
MWLRHLRTHGLFLNLRSSRTAAAATMPSHSDIGNLQRPIRVGGFGKQILNRFRQRTTSAVHFALRALFNPYSRCFQLRTSLHSRSLFDPASTDHFLAIIENGSLAWRDCYLRPMERDVGAAAGVGGDGGGGVDVAVADPHGQANGIPGRLAADPIDA